MILPQGASTELSIEFSNSFLMTDQHPNPDAGPGSPRLLLSESIPSQTELIEPTAERFLRQVGHLVAADGHRDAIDLALREALVNAIVHGNKRDPTKRVQVEAYEQSGRQVLIVVRDEGTGFDPSLLDDPTKPENIERATGRGIFLIRQFMDEVQFRDEGREIQMKKKC
jgi:serine/threonine-protein kinase RsbW